MKATGIVRRIDDLGRVVIPKEIRRTMRIREGDPLLITLTPFRQILWRDTQFSGKMQIEQHGTGLFTCAVFEIYQSIIS